MVYRPEKYIPIPATDLLSWVFGNQTYDQDKDIYIDIADESRRITARHARRCVRRLIYGFETLKVGPGDCVCLISFNDILYSMLCLGIVGTGACFVGSNPSHTFLELTHLFTICKPKIVVVEPELLQGILPAAKECGISLSNIFILDAHGQAIPNGFQSWKMLLRGGESDWVRFDDEKRAKSTIAALFSTSGTSGLPKVAAMSHHALVATNVQCYDSKQKSYEVSRLICVPQFHAFAAPLALIAPLREGHTTYIMKRFNVDSYINCIARFQITEIPIVPPILAGILRSPLAASGSIASLRFVWCAGAPLNKHLQKKFAGVLCKDARVAQLWGMTETLCITTFLYPERVQFGSVGRLMPNMEAKLVDENAREISEDCTPGEVYVRGPSILSAYLDNSTATEATFSDGWLKTGDIAYCDLGKWYIVDRAKDMIKVRGWQVAPAEIEACLLTHPRIADAAVVGVSLPGRMGGDEFPQAYVVVRNGTTEQQRPQRNKITEQHPLTEEEVKEFLVGRLARYKALTGGVEFVEAIPRGASGKILKKELRGDRGC